ncbi:hypothetical protein EV696_107156 [Permianibacter aggregans]|uniref:Uncharacterized protein n=1 Tax=Permianibacter aggregans TaxID=1510150 RepID=A0A4R6URM6_9GAMM|nr:hypothetical protein EV696_107156 [Permianibacter aggregans]
MRMALIKVCPYCLESLPFFRLSWSHLKFALHPEIVCPHCSSRIEEHSRINLVISILTGGVLASSIGRIISRALDVTIHELVLSGTLAITLILVLAYLTAPLKKA